MRGTMMRAPRRLLLVSAATALVLGACVRPAPAPPILEARIEDFAGYWTGNSAGSRLERDMALLVETAPDGSFDMLWRNIQARPAATGADEVLVFRDRDLVFRPGTQPKLWTAAVPGEGAYATASLDGATLTVEITGPTDEGGVERQIYRRTLLDARTMTLDYVREADGQVAVQLSGTFIRGQAPG
jgi:hypothetical protein